MARMPNGVLLVSKRTERAVHHALGELISLIRYIDDMPGKTGMERDIRKYRQSLSKLREKFNGK